MKMISVLLLGIISVLSYWIYDFNKALNVSYHDNAVLREDVTLSKKKLDNDKEQINELSTIIMMEFAKIKRVTGSLRSTPHRRYPGMNAGIVN